MTDRSRSDSIEETRGTRPEAGRRAGSPQSTERTLHGQRQGPKAPHSGRQAHRQPPAAAPAGSIRRYSAQDLSRYRLAAGVLCLEIFFAVLLRIFNWPALRRIMRFTKPAAVVLVGRPSEDRLLWAMHAIARRWPAFRNCLVRALVAEVALATPHEPVRVTIGVRRVAGELQAHAWVERCGRLIIGAESEQGPFAPLVTWQSPHA